MVTGVVPIGRSQHGFPNGRLVDEDPDRVLGIPTVPATAAPDSLAACLLAITRVDVHLLDPVG